MNIVLWNLSIVAIGNLFMKNGQDDKRVWNIICYIMAVSTLLYGIGRLFNLF